METLQRDDVRLHIVADALRRRFVLIVVVVALVTAAIGAYVMHLAPSYAASAKVLIRPIPGNALSLDSSKNGQQVTVAMETEAGLVNSPKVAALVSKALHATVTAGSPAVSATVPPNTQIVEIQYTAHSARAAQEGAQAYADAFLVFRAGEADDNLQHGLAVLAKQAKSAGDASRSRLRRRHRRTRHPTPLHRCSCTPTVWPACRNLLGSCSHRRPTQDQW